VLYHFATFSTAMKLDKQLLQSLPKVLLHEHLDGVLRPQTVIELAIDAKYTGLPTRDPDELSRWFFRGANQGSLAKYLEGFAHTIALMQTEEALQRIAYEQAEDLSRDGVIYFETRFAPVFHTQKGLTHQQIVAAVLKGLERGRKDFGISSGLIVCAMRNMNTSLEMAELAVDFRERGVVGFDLAGEEGGYPAKKHVDAFHYIQRENFNITIHAGEGYGKESIWQAIQHWARDAVDRRYRGCGWEGSEVGRFSTICIGQAYPPRDLPAEQRAHRRHAEFGGASLPDSLSGEIPRDVEHRQPADERHNHDAGIRSRFRSLWFDHR
jgi:hypothetical protein